MLFDRKDISIFQGQKLSPPFCFIFINAYLNISHISQYYTLLSHDWFKYSSHIIFLTRHIEMKCLMPTFPTKCPTTLFDFVMLSNAFHINHSFKKFKFPSFSKNNTTLSTLKLTLNLFWLIQRANSESYIRSCVRTRN